LGARFLADGSKERFCKKCGASAGQVAPAKASHATAATTLKKPAKSKK
jgi:large subunit ribosomal protein L24